MMIKYRDLITAVCLLIAPGTFAWKQADDTSSAGDAGAPLFEELISQSEQGDWRARAPLSPAYDVDLGVGKSHSIAV